MVRLQRNTDYVQPVSTIVVKVTGVQDDPPVISQIGPDPNILKLGPQTEHSEEVYRYLQ